MRLEAIAALLGHRSLEMTLVYARIADRVVADEYASASVNKSTSSTPPQPYLAPFQRSPEYAAITKLRTQSHARMLGKLNLHPASRTRPPHGISLRDLRLLPDSQRSSCPSSSANETTPVTTTNPNE